MTAPIFVPLLAAAWMLGAGVGSLAASYFLAILESSATPTARGVSWSGSSFKNWMRDGIDWPDGTIADHFAKGVYLFYMVLLWGGPAVLIARLAVGHSPWASVIAGAAFWLLFPIGLLSSLASDSRWTPFWPGLIVAYCKRPLQTLGFYLLSAPVLAVVVFTIDLQFVHTSKATLAWAVGLTPVATLAFFIYARLLGRFGMVLTFTRPERRAIRKRVPRAPRRPMHAYDERTRMFSPTQEVPDEPRVDAQPPEMRGIMTLYDGEVTGYAVDYAGTAPLIEEPKPAPIIHKFDDEDDEPIRVAEPPQVSDDRMKIAAELAKSTPHELALHMPSRIEEPTNPYGLQVVSFLFDAKTSVPWVALTAGLMLLALAQRGLDALRPE
jgi:hypothetical protein